jgi:hypothetical protein
LIVVPHIDPPYTKEASLTVRMEGRGLDYGSRVA